MYVWLIVLMFAIFWFSEKKTKGQRGGMSFERGILYGLLVVGVLVLVLVLVLAFSNDEEEESGQTPSPPSGDTPVSPPPPPPSNWTCNEGTCEEDSEGNYTLKSKCEEECKVPCTCTHGTANENDLCSSGEESCKSCNSGYSPSGSGKKKCVKKDSGCIDCNCKNSELKQDPWPYAEYGECVSKELADTINIHCKDYGTPGITPDVTRLTKDTCHTAGSSVMGSYWVDGNPDCRYKCMTGMCLRKLGNNEYCGPCCEYPIEKKCKYETGKPPTNLTPVENCQKTYTGKIEKPPGCLGVSTGSLKMGSLTEVLTDNIYEYDPGIEDICGKTKKAGETGSASCGDGWPGEGNTDTSRGGYGSRCEKGKCYYRQQYLGTPQEEVGEKEYSQVCMNKPSSN